MRLAVNPGFVVAGVEIGDVAPVQLFHGREHIVDDPRWQLVTSSSFTPGSH